MSDRAQRIAFSAPSPSGTELKYVQEVLSSGRWEGDGPFSKSCVANIRQALGVAHGLLTNSGTAALEMAALLAELGPSDEVIMPSFTYPSTANAVVLRGGIPIFVDVREDTLNIDENQIEEAINDRTKAIFVVHYAGVCCAMDAINATARKRGLLVVEDAAQAYLSSYKGRMAGSLGDLAAFSFHGTKNITCGEGGALATNRLDLHRRAEVIWEKGTDRSRFLRGEIDKYSWVDVGSSYLPSELVAAVLLAQLQIAPELTARRRAIWARYHAGFSELESSGHIRSPSVPSDCVHNGHLYYLLLPTERERDAAIVAMRERKIPTVFHYVPLHSSAAGRRYGQSAGNLSVTTDIASRLIRLPLHAGLTDDDVDYIVDSVRETLFGLS